MFEECLRRFQTQQSESPDTTDPQGRAGQEPSVYLSLQGDALLALWKVERRQLKNIITVVIKCSLEIHGLFETQESEEGLDVRVKIGKL